MVPSPPFLPLSLLLIVVFALCAHRHCRRRHPSSSSLPPPPFETDHKEAGLVGLLDLPLATLHVSTPEKRYVASSFRHRARIASATTISAEAVLGLRPPSPYPRIYSPLSRCPAVADVNAATTMIPCLSIAGPNDATADGNPSDPHTDVNAIVEGDAEMKTP